MTKFANEYWSPQTAKKHLEYSAEVIEDIYKKDLKTTSESNVRKVMMLEFSQYLENYLWLHFNETASTAHVMSIVYMVNEKFRERVPAWVPFHKNPENFQILIKKVMELSLADNNTADPKKNENSDKEIINISLKEQTALIIFLGHCFMSMEVNLVRDQVQKMVSLSMWDSVMEERRNQEIQNTKVWKKYWKAIKKKDAKLKEANSEDIIKENQKERWFLRNLIDKFVKVLDTIQEKAASEETVTYCEHFMLFMIDIEALLPTRRFFNTVLDDSKLIIHCSLSALNYRDEGKLFSQLLDQLKFYARFEISDVTGETLDDKQMMQIHYDRITSLQRAMFAKYPDNTEMRKFALATVASIDDEENLGKHFKGLETEMLYEIAEYLLLVPPKSKSTDEENEDQEMETESTPFSRDFLIELLVCRHGKRDSQLQELNEMPLYPSEEVIWDENIVPGEYYNGEGVLALPKLNLQFLTLHDYLLRNFKLFQLESTYEIRGDIEDIITR